MERQEQKGKTKTLTQRDGALFSAGDGIILKSPLYIAKRFVLEK